MPGKRCVVLFCSNTADLNTGVSLHSGPVQKESAQYLHLILMTLILLVIFQSALNTLKCLALGIQYRQKLQPGSTPKIWKDIGEENQANQVEIK